MDDIGAVIPGYREVEDSIEFSVGPPEVRDSLADTVKDAVAFLLPEQCRQPVFDAIDRALESADLESTNGDRCRGQHEVVLRVVDLLRRYDNPRLAAHCLMLLLAREPMSEVAIARQLGVTKAAVSAVKVSLQDALGMHSRVGRSDAARRKFSELAVARGPRRRSSPAWPAQSLWNRH
jgi:hypothetical protein